MKVMHVIVGLEVGGAEHMLCRLVIAQQKRWQCMTVSLTDIGPLGASLSDAGVQVRALGMRSPVGLLITVWRLRKLIQQYEPDVVQTWMPHSDLIGGLAARLAGVRNVVWGIRATTMVGASLATRAIRRLCAVLSHVVPAHIVSAAEASQRAHIALGYDAARMSVIPNGFDLLRFKPDSLARQLLRKEWGLDDNLVLIGHVGRWDDAKDHLGFIKAAGGLAHQIETCRFLMLGRNIDESNACLMQAIRDTGCPERFLLLGERSDVPSCLAAIDIFCLSSKTEGFPNVVGEAMACGVPCVVTDVGDASLMVGDTGWVVPKEDTPALTDALRTATLMPSTERQALGLLARERIVSEFSMNRSVERFSALLQSLVGQAR